MDAETGFRDDPEGGDSICKTCGRRSLEHDFGEFLAHLLEEPLEVGRAIQGRVVARLERALEGADHGR